MAESKLVELLVIKVFIFSGESSIVIPLGRGKNSEIIFWFVKKSNLAKVKTEQNTSRFAVGEKIDAKVLKKITKDDNYELSIKDLEIQEEDILSQVV